MAAVTHTFLMGILQERMYPYHTLSLEDVKGTVMKLGRSRHAMLNYLQMAYEKCYYSGPIYHLAKVRSICAHTRLPTTSLAAPLYTKGHRLKLEAGTQDHRP